MPASSEYINGRERDDQHPVEQSEVLLKTKLFVPTVRPNCVFRSRLVDQVNQGMEKSLILVSAPAGYGKTTLVSSWLEQSKLPAAWLSLDEGDNDPICFLRYLCTALQHVIPSLPLEYLNLQSVPLNAVLNLLVNAVSEHPEPFVLVLDDFHVIQSQAVLEIFTFLLERIPPKMHWVVLTRTDPALPLARLRARNQMVDIRAGQMRFNLNESAVFLQEVMGLNLNIDDIAVMETRTEGWIAGLQLAALSMQICDDTHAFVTAFAGSDHFIIDYLTEEVLKRQPDTIHSFLLRTSILNPMCGPLCDAVVNGDRNDAVPGQDILEELERKNVFLIPLDHNRRWYRYHHLFADMLTRRLEQLFPQELPGLHRRASRWYQQNGLIDSAIQHVLKAGDLESAIQLIEQNGCLLLIRGEILSLLRWMKAVETHTQNRPWFYILKGWISALTGQPDHVETLLQTAEALLPSQEAGTDIRTMQGVIAAARAYQANLQGDATLAVRFSRQALEYLTGQTLLSRSMRTVATALMGDASAMVGNLQDAQQAYLESMQIAQAAGDVHLVIVDHSNLANILVEKAQVHRAYQVYNEALQMAARPDGQISLIAGRLYAELSQITYEWNRLDDTSYNIQQSIPLCKQWGNMDMLSIVTMRLAWLEHALGNADKMQAAMRQVEELVNEHSLLPKNAIWLKSSLHRLYLVTENQEKAVLYIKDCNIGAQDEVPYMREPEYLLYLRLLLAQRRFDPALALSQRLLRVADASGRVARVIEVLILQALAYQGKKDPRQALAALARAMSLARPEGYVRLFLDEGEPLVALLYQAKSHLVGEGYAEELLSAKGIVKETQELPVLQTFEQLSARELEVLRLIEGGLSNQEIAAKLVLSITTVKRHISNIYGKMGVTSRTQAISLGKELGIFG